MLSRALVLSFLGFLDLLATKIFSLPLPKPTSVKSALGLTIWKNVKYYNFEKLFYHRRRRCRNIMSYSHRLKNADLQYPSPDVCQCLLHYHDHSR